MVRYSYRTMTTIGIEHVSKSNRSTVPRLSE